MLEREAESLERQCEGLMYLELLSELYFASALKHK